MSVNTTSITSGPYAGNDVTSNFDYTFRVDDKTQLIVYETDDVGAVSVLVVDVDYTVNGVGVDGGGDIDRIAGALPTDYTWYIRSDYKLTQLINFESQGGFFPDIHESAIDKLTFLVQQLLDLNDRTIRFPDSYSGTADLQLPEPEADKTILWNGTGDGLVNGPTVGTFAGYAAAALASQIAAAASETAAALSETNAGAAATQTALDVLATAADVITTAADVVLTNADVVQTALDVIATAADVITTNNNVTLTNADAVSTANDVLAAAALLDQFDDAYLGSKASDPTLDNDGDPLADGALYYNTTSKLLKVYDLGTTTWFAFPTTTLAGLTDVTLTSIASGEILQWNGSEWINQTLVGDNILINADFRINQRVYVSGTATSISNEYTLDRWRVVTSGESITFSTLGTDNTITCPAGGLEQVIESLNISGGTYVISWVGTATCTVNGTARTNGESFTLPANTNATVKFSSGTVKEPQIEKGLIASDFARRTIGEEIALCQRYYEKSYNLSTSPGTAGTAGCVGFVGSSTGRWASRTEYKVVKRITPTYIVYSPTTGATARVRNTINANDATFAQTSTGESGFVISALTSADANDILIYHYTADAEL